MITGKQFVALARRHIGERYILGACVPKDNPRHKGPWDCAEFTSWLVFQLTGRLYGCLSNSARPAIADAFTGSWARDAEALGRKISLEEAARTQGAFVLRRPGEAGIAVGHIAVSDGKGGTVEAHSAKKGVIASTLSGRRWDCGILVPGVEYLEEPGDHIPAPPSGEILRLGMQGAAVRELQRLLKAAGFDPGGIDGDFGTNTLAATVGFQRAKGLVPDGEVGPQTRRALALATRG